MSILSFIVLFIAGIVIGSVVNVQFWMPLIYSLPKSIYLFAKGKVRFMAIPAQFVAPIIWYCILTAIYVSTHAFAPFIHDKILFSPGFTVGWSFSLWGIVTNFFSKKGRADMADDYAKTTLRKFGKGDQSLSQP